MNLYQGRALRAEPRRVRRGGMVGRVLRMLGAIAFLVLFGIAAGAALLDFFAWGAAAGFACAKAGEATNARATTPATSGVTCLSVLLMTSSVDGMCAI